MVNVNNSSFLDPSSSIVVIKAEMATNLPMFKLDSSFDNGEYVGYGVNYIYGNIKLFIGGEKGGLDYKIFIGDLQYSLLASHPIMKQIYAASEENYRITITTIREFLTSKNLI